MPAEPSHIFLVGYRCTGKTTVGRKLAACLKRAFHDTDEWIVAAEGISITRIVADHGWDYFRALEKRCLYELSAGPPAVIATGGGIVLHPDNIACMQKRGTVVWLQASPAIILDRLRLDPATANSRPALTRQELAEEVKTTLAERYAHYNRAADLAVKTDAVTPDELVARIVNQLSQE
jgi:shikimate kinase